MRLIGAPEALVEFNEYVYLADQRINLSQFDTQFAQISGGTYVQQIPILEAGNIFSIFGNTYTGFTTTGDIQDVNITIDEYPMDEYGYPTTPTNSDIASRQGKRSKRHTFSDPESTTISFERLHVTRHKTRLATASCYHRHS